MGTCTFAFFSFLFFFFFFFFVVVSFASFDWMGGGGRWMVLFFGVGGGFKRLG